MAQAPRARTLRPLWGSNNYRKQPLRRSRCEHGVAGFFEVALCLSNTMWNGGRRRLGVLKLSLSAYWSKRQGTRELPALYTLTSL
jgi:hypothetical protein